MLCGVGARVTCDTLVRDLNAAVARFDDRRIEVIANGLPLWNGALGAEVGGRWSAEAAEFVRFLVHAKARAAPAVLRPALRGAYVHRWSGFLAAAASLSC